LNLTYYSRLAFLDKTVICKEDKEEEEQQEKEKEEGFILKLSLTE
jgi:hypothetical protein